MDSPAANAAFAKQINVKFPLLSDMNKKMLKEYGILKGYDVQNETYQWAQRANIVIDKNGVVRWKVINPLREARDIADYQKALAALR